MLLRATVRDCLFLNWALPAAALPPPPAPLRYQLHPWQGEDYTFASALLFFEEGLHLPSLPLLWLTYPQCNVRLYVLDGQGVPSVLLCTRMMPAWVASGVRLMVREPAASARLAFPRPSRKLGDGRWRWRVERGRAGQVLDVTAWQAAPQVGHGPRLGTWEQSVEYFEERPRSYLPDGDELRRIETVHPPPTVWPLQAEVAAGSLLSTLLPLGDGLGWPPLHSVFLCPEIPFAFELGVVAKPQVAPAVAQAAASRSAARRRLPERPAEPWRPASQAARRVVRSAAEARAFERALDRRALARRAIDRDEEAAAVELAAGA
jgi:hypothetical protein